MSSALVTHPLTNTYMPMDFYLFWNLVFKLTRLHPSQLAVCMCAGCKVPITDAEGNFQGGAGPGDTQGAFLLRFLQG